MFRTSHCSPPEGTSCGASLRMSWPRKTKVKRRMPLLDSRVALNSWEPCSPCWMDFMINNLIFTVVNPFSVNIATLGSSILQYIHMHTYVYLCVCIHNCRYLDMYNAYMHIHMFPICLMFMCIIMCIYIYISLSVFSLFKEYNMYRYICITIYIYTYIIYILCVWVRHMRMEAYRIVPKMRARNTNQTMMGQRLQSDHALCFISETNSYQCVYFQMRRGPFDKPRWISPFDKPRWTSRNGKFKVLTP